MRRLGGLILLSAGLLALTDVSRSQPLGGKMSKFGSLDPNDIFDKYAKGKDVIVISELDPKEQQKLQFVAGMMGIKIGESVTRDQFKQHVEQIKGSGMMKGMMGGGGLTPPAPQGTTPPTGDQTPPSDPSKGGPPSFGSRGSGMDRDGMIEMAFRKLDKNNDGTLSADEIPENMQREREAYDSNKDGFIDLAEFKNFVATVRPPREADNRGNPDSGKPSENGQPATSVDRSTKTNPDEVKPTIYRVGHLPKDLPEWFVRLDKSGDCDGQVGLWEARNDKTVLEEFSKYDLNGDGLITAEEVLRFKATLAKKTSSDDSSGRDRSRDRDSRSTSNGPPSFPTPSAMTFPLPTTGGAPPAFGGGMPSLGGGGGPPSFGGFRGMGIPSSGTIPPPTPSGLTTPSSTQPRSESGDRPSFGRPPSSSNNGSGDSGRGTFGRSTGRPSSR
jgi:hypothetical protein